MHGNTPPVISWKELADFLLEGIRCPPDRMSSKKMADPMI
jgi:hypothetical protein